MTIDFKFPQDDTIPSIHDQIKYEVLFSTEHWTIKSLLEANGINHAYYYGCMSRKIASKKLLEDLIGMGVKLSDDILISIFPKM